MEDEQSTRPAPPPKLIRVELRELEALLREQLGNSMTVESFNTKSLLPEGENYGSTMLRVDAEVRRDEVNSEPERLSFVAKMLPPTEFQRIVFESPMTFRKEIYMFTNIVPAYRALERECGIPEPEIFDPLPKLYGSRLSLEPGEGKFDEDAVILMEDLKLKNYVCGNRRIGLDLAHARALVKSLARFHALGIALKIKKPRLFDEFKMLAKATTLAEGLIVEVDQFLLSNAKKIPCLSPHLAKIEKALPSCNINYLLRAPAEPWGTIIHTDLWVNNVMFRDHENGAPEHVKLVDFQNYAYSNPLLDLVFFVFSSCNTEVRSKNVESLVDLYYETITSHLARLKCDVNSFSRDSFNKHLADAAHLEYSHCLFMLRVIIRDSNDKTDPAEGKAHEDLFKVETPDDYRERFAEISLRYLKENWI